MLVSSFMGTISTNDVGPEPIYPFDTTVIKGKAIFLENPDVMINGYTVRCECGNKPYVVKLDYGVVTAYCDECAPIKKRSSYFNWNIFPWGNKDE